ncbi:bifunctional 2-polyprenyl-6-hydroxyphenol methylase/3-demethylubiquinol 3-O-methyltransferase UbiG [Candidatus Bealeia paramacronuclearis]
MRHTKLMTVDAREIENFSAHAASWWDEKGAFRILHRMNPLRLQFIIDNLKAEGVPNLEKMNVLDVGCGGGLLCEPLARLGAQVTGIDATNDSISIAKTHASALGLNINYRSTTAEDLASEGLKFDVVISYEVIEHVANPEAFLQALTSLVAPQGHLFLSTLNRTAQSYLFGILTAEYILKWAPKGTHTWEKFISPQELSRLLNLQGFTPYATQGLTFFPLTRSWKLTPDVSMNYLMYARPEKLDLR